MSLLNNGNKNDRLTNWLAASQSQLVVVVFYAEWAGSAQLLRGYMDRFQKDNAKVLVDWVNIDEEMQLVDKLSINQVPTIMIFQNREVVDLMKGVVSRSKLERKIKLLKSFNKEDEIFPGSSHQSGADAGAENS